MKAKSDDGGEIIVIPKNAGNIFSTMERSINSKDNEYFRALLFLQRRVGPPDHPRLPPALAPPLVAGL